MSCLLVIHPVVSTPRRPLEVPLDVLIEQFLLHMQEGTEKEGRQRGGGYNKIKE
jgi:hypothetical protein